MLLSAILVCLLAPLAVLAKITLTSFSYSKGVAHMVVKAWPDGPPTFSIDLIHGSDIARLLSDLPSVTGPLDVTLPNTVPPRSGYRLRLVSAIYGDDSVYYTTKAFTVASGDFATITNTIPVTNTITSVSSETTVSGTDGSTSYSLITLPGGSVTSVPVNPSATYSVITLPNGSVTSVPVNPSTIFTAITLPNGSVTSVPVTDVPTATTSSYTSLTTYTDTSLSTTVTSTITGAVTVTGTAISAITTATVPTATSSASKQFSAVISMVFLPLIGIYFTGAL